MPLGVKAEVLTKFFLYLIFILLKSEFKSHLLKTFIIFFFNSSSVKPIEINVLKTKFAWFSILGFDKS